MTRDVGRTYPLPLPSPLPLPWPLPVPIPSPLPLPLPVSLPFHIPLPFSLYRFPCTTIGFILTLVAALTTVFAFKIHRKYSHIGTGKLSLLSTPAITAWGCRARIQWQQQGPSQVWILVSFASVCKWLEFLGRYVLSAHELIARQTQRQGVVDLVDIVAPILLYN